MKQKQLEREGKPEGLKDAQRLARRDALILLEDTVNDIDKKKHKKNPFHGKYVSFCLSSFSEVRQIKL